MSVTNRKGFMIYHDEMEAILANLTDAEVGALFRAQVRYSHAGLLPAFLSDRLHCMWPIWRIMVDKSEQHYQSTCEKRRHAANMRWHPLEQLSSVHSPAADSVALP